MSRKLIHGLLILSGVYTLLPFLYIARYDHPSADDYTYAVELSKRGLWDIVKEEYLHWSGRYFSRIIWWLDPANYHSVVGYRIASVLMILLFVVAVGMLVNSLVKDYLSLRQVLGLSSLFIFLYLSKAPSIAEAFYWFSSASIYQTANILFILLLVGMVKLYGRAKPSIWPLLGCSILCVVIIGCNEVSLIITFLFIHFYTLGQYLRNRRWSPYLIFLCGVCVISAIVEVFAPGNFVRLTNAQFSRSMAWTVIGSLSITAVNVSQWVGPLLAVSVLYVPLFGMPIAQKMRETNRSAGVPLKGFVGFFLGTLCFLLVFVVWVGGGSNLGRIFDVIYLFFLLGYFFILQLLLNNYVHRLEGLSPYSAALCWVGLALFVSSLFDINNNISTAYVDIVSGKAKQYDKELTERLRVIKECRSDTCHVPALSDAPSTIFFTDIRPWSDRAGLWINQSYSTYFNVGFVVSDAPPPVATPNMESLRNMGRTMRGRMMKK